MSLEFEWDEDKAKTNLNKHGVTFEEASSVFGDPLAVTFPDPDHSEDEDRELTIGYSDNDRLLIVSHTRRGDNIRLINARRAAKSERDVYETR